MFSYSKEFIPGLENTGRIKEMKLLN